MSSEWVLLARLGDYGCDSSDVKVIKAAMKCRRIVQVRREQTGLGFYARIPIPKSVRVAVDAVLAEPAD